MEFTAQLWDYSVILIYLIGVFALAFSSSKKTADPQSEDILSKQYLANKSLTFTESICSIIATEVSALTFVGIPSYAFTKDFSFLQVYIGAIWGRFIIAKLILPRIYDKGLTLYGIISQSRSTPNGHKALSSIYIVVKILSVGVRLYSGSILVAEFFSININIALIVICVVTFFYTLIGGLKAVVRTDIIQMGLFITGGIVAHSIIPDVANSAWSDMMTQAFEAGKLSLFDLSSPYSFFVGIAGGFLFDICTHGTDQDYIQRLIANRSLKSAQRAIFLSSFASIAVGALFLGVGALLWSYYQSTPVEPPVKPDFLFAYFITHYFPVGLKGLMVAGALAATMSTLDSSINALCSCLQNDIFLNRSLEKLKRYYQQDTLLITFLMLIVAYASSHSDGLLLLGLKVASWTGGTIFAIFLAKMVFQSTLDFSLNLFTTLFVLFMGILGVYINYVVLESNWSWNVYYGTSSSLLAIFLITLFSKKESR